MRVAGLFAGIGGVELGLERAGGFTTQFLCENWGPAREVLGNRFACRIRDEDSDVAGVAALPKVDVVTAGFPCTDLSQAGRTAGIRGKASGLVSHVFRLLSEATDRGQSPSWLVIENVSNMLQLDQGNGMRYLVSKIEAIGMRWAYRVVDSRFTGVPQRRRRVLLVASRSEDPGAVLFADDATPRPESDYATDSFGFYWTEGRGGLGWAQDAVPTLKGGSTIGIPSPPAIWIPGEDVGRKLLMPNIEDAEEMQGFPRGWTSQADTGRSNGPRWKLVGNAVTVGVAEWLGRRLKQPGDWTDTSEIWDGPRSWPPAAWGRNGKVHRMEISEYPEWQPYRHLIQVVNVDEARPLTHRGSAGFWRRLQEGNLGRHPGFREDVAEHVEATDPVAGIAATSG